MPDRRDQQVEQLIPDFFHRQAADAAWGHTVSFMQSLTGLRGFWPLSAAGVSGQAIDMQGLGNHLTLNGNPEFSFDNLAPLCDYDGTGDFHDITDAASGNAFDILGTETFIPAAERGMFIGGWFKPDIITAGTRVLMSKDDLAAQRSYSLLQTAALVQFFVFPGGIAVTSAVNLVAGAWHHIIARFIPSAAPDIFVNGTQTVGGVAGPAALTNSSADFTIASDASGTGRDFDGKASMCAIGASRISPTHIYRLYELSAPLYGIPPRMAS